ncbi:hypothetical protein Micbo1qcDRAFT_162581, partial [Microdochium bolleyi]
MASHDGSPDLFYRQLCRQPPLSQHASDPEMLPLVQKALEWLSTSRRPLRCSELWLAIHVADMASYEEIERACTDPDWCDDEAAG